MRAGIDDDSADEIDKEETGTDRKTVVLVTLL